MSVNTIQFEAWLLNWTESSNGGAKIVLGLHAEDLEPFKALGLRKGSGKKMVAGQRFMAVLALIGEDEKTEDLPAGPLCKLAAIWCKDPAFQEWLTRTFPSLVTDEVIHLDEGGTHYAKDATSKALLCKICGVESRKALDHDSGARETFNELIRRPYQQFLHETHDAAA